MTSTRPASASVAITISEQKVPNSKTSYLNRASRQLIKCIDDCLDEKDKKALRLSSKYLYATLFKIDRIKTPITLTQAQFDSVNEFLRSFEAEKTIPKNLSRLRMRSTALGMYMLFSTLLAGGSTTALAFFGLLIKSFSDEWREQKKAMSQIEFSCGSDSSFSHDVGTFNCAEFATVLFGLCESAYICGSEFPGMPASECDDSCRKLDTIGGKWGGSLTGILVAIAFLAVAVTGCTLTTIAGCKTIGLDLDLFYSSRTDRLPRRIVNMARIMLAECKTLPEFAGMSLETPFKNILNAAHQVRLKQFQENQFSIELQSEDKKVNPTKLTASGRRL